jgi:hypothetical protein
MLLLHLIYSIDLLSKYAILSNAVIIANVCIVALSVFHVLATKDGVGRILH